MPKTIDYDRMKRVWPTHKGTLTRRVNRARKTNTVADWQRVIDHCVACAKEWDEIGCWPDHWPTFNIAAQDAEAEISRLQGRGWVVFGKDLRERY